MVLSQDPANSVSVLLETIEAYSKVSGYCINWHKSEAMPVSQTCSHNQLSAFNWLPKGMKYLGIELDPDIREIMTTNMEKVLNKIKTNLDNWSKLHLMLWGKVNAIKMVVAPQINYLTGMIPICIPKQLLVRYDKIIKQFLWDGKKPQIRLDKLFESKKRGGLSLPNKKYYSVAFEMSKLTGHWDEAGADLDWVLIEQELTSPFKPMEALAQTVKNEKNKVNNPILGHSKMVWQEVHKRCKISQHTQKYAYPYGTI